MTQVIVLKSFNGKHGYFQPAADGKPIHMEANYAEDCRKNGLVRFVGTPQPARRQAMPAAPQEKKPGEKSKPLGDGPAQAPQSLRAARAFAKKTSKKSVAGASLR